MPQDDNSYVIMLQAGSGILCHHMDGARSHQTYDGVTACQPCGTYILLAWTADAYHLHARYHQAQVVAANEAFAVFWMPGLNGFLHQMPRCVLQDMEQYPSSTEMQNRYSNITDGPTHFVTRACRLWTNSVCLSFPQHLSRNHMNMYSQVIMWQSWPWISIWHCRRVLWAQWVGHLAALRGYHTHLCSSHPAFAPES